MTAVRCPVCKSELRVTAMTAAGVTRACDCGRTTMKHLAEGESLNLGIVKEAVDEGWAGVQPGQKLGDSDVGFGEPIDE